MRLSCSIAVGIALLSCHNRHASFFVDARIGAGEIGRAKDEDDGARVRRRRLPARGRGSTPSYEAKIATRTGTKPQTGDRAPPTQTPEIVDPPEPVVLPADDQVVDVLPPDAMSGEIPIVDVKPADAPSLDAAPPVTKPERVVGVNDLVMPPDIKPLDADPIKREEAPLNTAAMESPPNAPTIAEEIPPIGSATKPQLEVVPEDKLPAPPADLSVPPPPSPADLSVPPPPPALPVGLPGLSAFGGPSIMGRPGISVYRPWVCTKKRTDIADRYERFEIEKADATALCQVGDDLLPATAEMFGDEYDDDTLPEGIKRKQWVGGAINRVYRRCDPAFSLDEGNCLPEEICVKDVDSCACNALPCYKAADATP